MKILRTILYMNPVTAPFITGLDALEGRNIGSDTLVADEKGLVNERKVTAEQDLARNAQDALIGQQRDESEKRAEAVRIQLAKEEAAAARRTQAAGRTPGVAPQSFLGGGGTIARKTLLG